MIGFGTSGHGLFRRMILAAFATAFFALPAPAQDAPTPLGDVARAMRKKKEQAQTQPQAQPAPPLAPAPTVIDNDNFDEVLADAEARHLTSTSFLYSFNDTGKTFQVSAPDVTCSLSFNAHANALLTRTFIQTDLPDDELRKLDGPAAITQDGLEISVTNGTQWRVEELTVGVTVVRSPAMTAASPGGPRLVTAAAQTTTAPSAQMSAVPEKQSDTTTLYHLRAVAMPSSTVVYKAQLSVVPAPDQEWHWAIVQARGIPPRPQDSALSLPFAPNGNVVIP
jgi:hypothetical protein